MVRVKFTPSVSPGVPDIVTHRLTITVDGVPNVVDVQPGGSTEMAISEGLAVRVTQIDIDDAGNPSPESAPYEFTAADTFPPPQPAPPTAEVVGEE